MSAQKLGGGKGPVNMGVGSSGDILQTITNIMREMQKSNKFVHKQDIYSVISNSYDYQSFERAIDRLLQDGTIYTTYDSEIFTLEN
jgi:hypothetical protein